MNQPSYPSNTNSVIKSHQCKQKYLNLNLFDNLKHRCNEFMRLPWGFIPISVSLILLVLFSGCVEQFLDCPNGSGCYIAQAQPPCPNKPMEIESELGVITDFEVYQITDGGLLGCNITFEDGTKTVSRGQVCSVLTTGRMLVSYGWRCEQGYEIYGTVEAIK